MTVDNIEDFKALEPFFRVIKEGLAGLVDGSHFFDLLADDVVFEFIITVPDYPRLVAGRDNLIELYRGYQSTFFLDRCFDLRVHRADDSTVTLEYASEGKVHGGGGGVGVGGPHRHARIHDEALVSGVRRRRPLTGHLLLTVTPPAPRL